MANVVNLAFDLGETWIIDINVNDSDGLTPYDLTGASIALTVKNSTGYVIQAAQTAVTILSASTGLARIQCTPAQQAAAGVTAQVASYLIRVTLASGLVTDQAKGVFEIKAVPS